MGHTPGTLSGLPVWEALFRNFCRIRRARKMKRNPHRKSQYSPRVMRALSIKVEGALRRLCLGKAGNILLIQASAKKE